MPTPKPTLYHWPGSSTLVSHIALIETKLPFTLTNAPDPSSPYLLTLNPKGRVPILALDSSTIITESPAVLTAIAHLAPEKNLLGRTPLETVRVYEWLNYLSGTVHGQAFGALWRPARFSDDVRIYEALKVGAFVTIRGCYRFIEDRLSGSGTAYAVGDDMTVVDPFLLVFYRWGLQELSWDMAKEYPAYAALISLVIKRESVIEAYAADGLELCI